MRVVWLSHRSALGGAEISLCEAVAALATLGHEIHVVMPSEGPLRERLAGAATVHVTPFNPWVDSGLPAFRRAHWLLYNAFRAVPALVRLFRALRPDVVASNTIGTPVGALAAKWTGRRHVWFVRELDARRNVRAYTFHLGRRLSLAAVGWLSDTILVNSETLQGELAASLPRARFCVAPPPVLVRPLPKRPREGATGLRLVNVGEWTPGKGQQDALEALALLRGEGLDVALELVGGGAPEQGVRLAALARERGVAGAVRFSPFEPRVEDVLLRSDVVLVCSRGEAFGRVAIEAMKAGRALVGAASGNTVALISHGRTGLLYRPGDAADLAAQVKRLLVEPGLAEELEQAAALWAHSQFGLESHARTLEAALRGHER